MTRARSLPLFALAASLLLLACGEEAPAPPPGNDGATPTDGGSSDGSSSSDASMDATSTVDSGADAAEPEDGGPEGGFPRIDGSISLGDAMVDPDEDSGVGASCTAGTCGPGSVCLDDGAGGMTCQPSGHPCGGGADCPEGSTCLAGANVCEKDADPDACNDSRDCPPGFSCEDGSCTDRRIGCDMDVDLCPFGFVCFQPPYVATGFCRRASNPCATDQGCFATETCVDVAGDGRDRCMRSGDCVTGGCETAGEVCGIDPRGGSECMKHGPCASEADCASGFTCTDLWGDGLDECVPTGGSCTSVSSCSGSGICGSPTSEAEPDCVSEPAF
ncbi:MAG: hypothetical protein ACOCXM_05425 [Myxococcota bacterium]